MKISPITAQRSYVKKNPNFKAEVRILPNAAKHNQPKVDKFIMEEEAKKLKDEIEKRFPDKNDNIEIDIEVNGFAVKDFFSRDYFNSIKVYMGYKDPEVTRKNILERSVNPPHEDYIALQPETIEKLKNRDSELMEKIQEKPGIRGSYYTVDEMVSKIEIFRNQLINDVVAVVNNALDYGVTEYVEPEPIKLSPQYDPSNYFI